MPDHESIAGKVALVTGGGSGIGLAIAQALADASMQIAICGRSLGKLEAASPFIRGGAFCFACDAREERDIEAAIRQTVARFGALDLLVNNAGIFDMKPIEETTADFWDDVHATNLRGAFLFCRHAWPHLKASRGQIVNVSSIAGTKGFTGGAAYCASKYGLNGLSEVLRIEGQPHGIRVFSICPGSVDTPLWDPLSTKEEQARMMRPETIADLTAWLVASPRNIDVGGVVVNNFTSPWNE